jgi:hypothetical protein
VVIVSVVVRAVLDPAGDRVAGLKAHVEYCGRPEQLKFTVPLNPPAGVKVMVEVPDWPATIVKDVGLAASEKLGATDALTVTLRLASQLSWPTVSAGPSTDGLSTRLSHAPDCSTSMLSFSLAGSSSISCSPHWSAPGTSAFTKR